MENKSCKTIAIVSGKGGSGKTMLTATIAKILDISGSSVLLIDADFGTAGLTYYLGLNEVNNISVGLANLIL
ncbi:nucleotide-binding protein [Photobacterium leiognathi]|uniref:nucleotide-binding protein n=1 Tax=Photobacterium leiognathi TaxID=553611 RepID=UPI002733E390|nr:P-loop NTPase [Photobacterium leiognathi]